MLATIAQTINQSVQLDQVLDDCLVQVQQFFQSDRVLICRFDAAYNVVIELEALAQPELALLGQTINDTCFAQGWAERYREGYVTACNDAQAINLNPCYAALLAQMQVQASLAVGILQGDQIWGLMIVHYCHKPYEWQQSEIDLLKQLGLQIGIANQKAILYTQLEAELAERRHTEAALQISEQNLRAIFNNVSSGILVHDLHGMVQDANDLVLRLYQLEREQIPHISVLNDCSAPNNPFHLIPEWWARALEGEPVNFEWKAKRFRDGTVFDVEVRLTQIVLDGEAMILGSVQDISERKRAEQQLQESQQLLALVLDTIPHKVFWKDRNSNLLGWNRAFAAIIGCSSAAELVGKTHDAMPWTAEEEAWYRECDRRVMVADQPELGIIETQLQADGSLAWIETSKVPLHDAEGNVIGLLGVYQDITDRKQAEAELSASQQRLSLLIQQTPLAVIEWDTTLQVRSWNRAAEQIFGFTAAEVLGRTMSFLLPTTIEPLRGDQVPTQLRAQPGGNHSSIQNVTKAGHAILCEWYNNPLVNEAGETIGMASMVLDITDRHHAEVTMRQSKTQLKEKAEQLEQTLQELRHAQSQMVQSEKMSGLGQLVAGVAHEINNPVNFIYGNLTHANSYTNDILGLLGLYQQHYPTPHVEIQTEVDAIDLDFLLEDLPKLLASMRVGAERIQKIVASLRNFSRMDEAEVKAVNLHDGIDSTLMILQHRLKMTPDRPGIQIIKAYGNLPLVECYAGQLNQVFMNVLSNAIDALEDQMEHQHDFQPTITICTTLIDATHVRMSFADNGSGIPDAVKARLFDPFFTTKPVGKGTGMGLSISHQIVTEKHGDGSNVFPHRDRALSSSLRFRSKVKGRGQKAEGRR